MSRGPEIPSVAQLLDIAEDFGIDMTAERAGEYRDAMSGGIRALRRIDDLVEERPEVKYPRTPGRRARPEENPYNAWYWMTDIKGAGAFGIDALFVTEGIHGDELGMADPTPARVTELLAANGVSARAFITTLR